MNNQEKFLIFKEVVLENDFFLKYNLKYKEEKRHENSLGENYNIYFNNSIRGFSITLVIIENSKYPLMHLLGFAIHNLDDSVDEEENRFTDSSWLRFEDRKVSNDSFFLETYEGGFREKLDAFFIFLNQLFEEEETLKKILNGSHWMYYPFNLRDFG